MVKITKIDFVRTAACLTLDDDRKVWLTRSDLLESGWREGQEIGKAAFDRFVELHQYPRALNQAVSMLARRPCSKGEILQNLKRHRYTDDVIGLVVYKLEKENLLDDREFSDLWVKQRGGKLGSLRIRQELRRKGVSEETAEEALSQISDEDQLESAVALAEKAWSRTKPGEDPGKTRQRIISSLVRKGFTWDQAKKASDDAESSRST